MKYYLNLFINYKMNTSLFERLCFILDTELQNIIPQLIDPRNAIPIFKQLDSLTLSILQYYSLFCINNNIGNVILAELILKYMKSIFFDKFNGTITLTYGDVAESHVGMQQIGNMSEYGFSFADLQKAQIYFRSKGCETIIIKLNDFLPENGQDDEEGEKFLKQAKTEQDFQAYVLVARNGLKYLTNDNKGENLLTEMLFYEWDSKLYNKNKKIVQNKNARSNLNFDDHKQVSDFINAKGTTISWAEVPLVSTLRKHLNNAFGDSANNLKCEGNKYSNIKEHGINFHGDSERRKVIGVRLGKSMNMHWQWYYNGSPKGLNMSIILNPGDIYCMSEKAVGTDWMPNLSKGWKKKRYALRHAAGAPKYTTNSVKIQIRNQRKLESNQDIIIGDIYHKPKKSQKTPNPTWNKIN